LGILNYQGKYFVGEKAWLQEYLAKQKEPVVLDVGANIGSYSKFVLESNKGASVFAFEPHPKTYHKLNLISKNNNFQAFNFGVGDKREKLELYDYDTNDGSSHATLYQDVIKDLHKGIPISHLVEVVTLDDFILKQNLSKIDLLKIDTEGNEYKVLMGCNKALKEKKIRAIHMEFNEMNIISKVSFKDFWDLLSDFEFYRILPGGELLPIKNYSPVICEIYAFQNIIALLKK
jgi:FkbM family methyltransferase